MADRRQDWSIVDSPWLVHGSPRFDGLSCLRTILVLHGCTMAAPPVQPRGKRGHGNVDSFDGERGQVPGRNMDYYIYKRVNGLPVDLFICLCKSIPNRALRLKHQDSD